MLSPSGKRNKIANYMDSLPEEFEVLEDNLGSNDPSISLATKSRIINLSCDESGKVKEEFSMKEGTGDKEEFLKKQEAYDAILHYYNDYYTGAKVTKSSFEEGTLTIELENRIVTLSYDAVSKTIEEKDKLKKSKKATSYEQITLFDLPKEQKAKEKSTKKEVIEKKVEKASSNESTLEKKSVKKESSNYDKWSDGLIVINKYNKKSYRVKKDNGNIIEVFDKEHGYLIMARADLEVSE